MCLRTLVATTENYVCLQLLHVLSVRASWDAEDMLSWCVRSVYTLALFSSLCDVGYMMLSVELWLLGASVLAICMMPNEWYLFSEKRHSVSHYADVVIMLVRNRSMNVYVLVRPWISIDLMSRHASCYDWSLWLVNTYCNQLQSEVLIVPWPLMGDSCSLVHMFIG